MNGIEALQAMKNGHIVRYIRNRNGSRSIRDILFCYHNRLISDQEEYSKHIYCKLVDEWNWHQSEYPADFWLKNDNFEIAIMKARK